MLTKGNRLPRWLSPKKTIKSSQYYRQVRRILRSGRAGQLPLGCINSWFELYNQNQRLKRQVTAFSVSSDAPQKHAECRPASLGLGTMTGTLCSATTARHSSQVTNPTHFLKSHRVGLRITACFSLATNSSTNNFNSAQSLSKMPSTSTAIAQPDPLTRTLNYSSPRCRRTAKQNFIASTYGPPSLRTVGPLQMEPSLVVCKQERWAHECK